MIVAITLPLLGVVGQLQRLIPLLRQQIVDNNETRAGVRTLLDHFGIKSSPATSPASTPASNAQ
jgi:hypothetical protein